VTIRFRSPADAAPVSALAADPPKPAATPVPAAGSAGQPPASPARESLLEENLFGDLQAETKSPTLELDSQPAIRLPDADAREAQAREYIRESRYDEACEILAELLKLDPRNRPLRALYHVTHGLSLARDGKPVDARTQLEAALVHDPECAEARAELKKLGESGKKGGLFRRLFR
jgi:tetratricopeptide (TPR) repeat protein